MIFEKSYSEISQALISTLESSLGVAQLSAGSRAKTLANALALEMNTLYQVMDANFLRAFVSQADGVFLDLIGELVGVTRLGEERIFISSESHTVAISNPSSATNPIVIPPGTLIKDAEIDPTYVFKTVNEVTVGIGKKEYASVVPINLPPIISIGAGTLVFINIDGVSVINEKSIGGGREVEGDENLRFRITNQALVGEGANETAIRLAALVVPGVADVVIDKYAQGLGTYEVLIKGQAAGPLDPIIISRVNNAIEAAQALGVQGITKDPISLNLILDATIAFRSRSTLSSSDKDSILRSIKTNLIDYVNNLDIGESLNFDEVIALFLRSHSDVIKVTFNSITFKKTDNNVNPPEESTESFTYMFPDQVEKTAKNDERIISITTIDGKDNIILGDV